MRPRILLMLLLVIASFHAKATHMSGGEIYWECVGPNQYLIKLVVYRDCAGINVDPSYNLQLTSPCGNRSLTVTTPGGVEISQLCDIELPNSTCNGGTLPGIQQYIYTGTITLPNCDSWSIRWTNIYRNNAIVNLMSPGTQEMFIEAVMNNATAPCNDSPVFTNTAIPYVCLGYPFTFSYGAFDPDADSLSYALIGARRAGGNPINYVAPNTATEPIPGLVLDPATGLISFTLNAAGNWVVVVRVTQYNAAGQVIGTVMRDMQFVGYPCDNIPPDPATGLVSGLTGTAIQTGPRAVQVCESGSFCFDMVINDVNLNNVLTSFSNIQQNLPGASFTYSGINPITAQVCWEAVPGTAGFYAFIVNANDGACPIPAIQTYVYSVTVLPGVHAYIEVEDESCLGNEDGSLTAVVTTGESPYSYSWSNGSSEASIYGEPGEHTVTIEDANGCVSHVLTGTIGTAAHPNEADAGTDMLMCMDELPVQLQGTLTNATEGIWSGGAGTYNGTGLNVQYTPTADEILNGGVVLTLTTTNNEGCPPASDDIFIALTNSFATADIVSTDATCYGQNNGQASFIPESSIFTYSWNDPLAQTTATATGLGAGTYEITVTDKHGCSVVMVAEIGPAEPLTLVEITATDETCLGAGDGSVTVNAIGGTTPYAFEWSNGGMEQTTYGPSGDYSVIVTDANGCTLDPAQATIGAAALPNEANAGSDLIACMDELPMQLNGTVVNATSGVWSGDGTFTGNGLNVQYMPSAAEIASGEATVILTTTDNTGCPPATDDVMISIPNSFANGQIAVVDATCHDVSNGSATYSPDLTGNSYLWDDALAQTNPAATSLGAGTYNLTIIDQFGCSITLPAVIGPAEPLTVASLDIVDETCLNDGDGSATVTVTGGTAPYEYLWSNGDTGPTINDTSGDYSVSIIDANGCTPITADAAIGAAALPNSADAGADVVVCMDELPVQLNGTITNAPDGVWSGGSEIFNGTGANVQYTPSSADIAAGSVTLTLSTVGNTGCPPASDNVVITIPNSFADGIITTTDATCYDQDNGSAEFAPADPSFTYSWNDAQAQNAATAINLGPGDYLLTVTDVHGCDVVLPAFIGPASEVIIQDITTVDENCLNSNDGSATVNVTGGTPPYTYSWSNGGDQATIVAASGNYTVLVSDANGCTPISGEVTIGTQGMPNSADAGNDVITCLNDYPIQIQGTVVNATSGVWSGGNGAINGSGLTAEYWPTITEIIAGGVDLVLTTVGNETCPPASDTVHLVLSNALLNATIAATNANCNGNADGTLTFSPADPLFTYEWNTPGAPSGPVASGLAAGDHTVTVTDTYGCEMSFTGTITEPDELLIVNIATADATCNGAANGTAVLELSGGTQPYEISWSNGATGNAVMNLGMGEVTASITDANGCTVQGTAVIDQPDPIILQANIPDTVCVNAPVLLTANATGGSGNYTFNWTGLGTGDSLTVEFPAPQFVTLTVMDDAGCPGSPMIEPIYVLDLSLAEFDVYGNTTVCVGSDVTIGANVSGYPGAYAISWPGIQLVGPGPFTFPLNSGMNVEVILSNTCGDIQNETITLLVDVPPAVNLPPIIAEGCAPLTVQFPNLPLGNVSWAWDLGNGMHSTAASPVVVYQAGTYTASLTVTTPFGCSSTGNASGQIIAHGSPTAAFTATPWTADLDNALITFNNTSTGNITSYSWLFGDGGTSGTMNPQHLYTEVGSFSVDLFVQDANGCTSTTSHIVQITPVYDITLPNAFTPNGEGGAGGGYSPYDLNNDVFYAFVRDVQDFRMRIFNRWGELVFESDDLKVGWDGYYKGELSQQDVYIVQTWIRFIDGREIQKLSDLTLFR